jgi:hypothetical protein
MRKALIAVIVAAALFAVGAFAASFTLSAEDVASGSNGVDRCASHVDVDFGTPARPDSTSGVYQVSGATIRFYTSAGPSPTAAVGCAGFTVRVAIGMQADPNSTLFTYTDYTANAVVDATGATTVTFSPALDVSAIRAASVVIDGKTLTANL